MSELTVRKISDLRLAGFHVTNKEGRIYVEGNGFIAEQDFGVWYLFTSASEIEYIDMFDTFDELHSYYKANYA